MTGPEAAKEDGQRVDECPDCGETGRYDGRVLLGGRGIYRCACGCMWQDADEKPTTKGIAVLGSEPS